MPDRGHTKLPELASKVFHKFSFLLKKQNLACCFGVVSSDFLTESRTKIEFLRNRDSMYSLLFNSIENNPTSRDYIILRILKKKLQSFDDVAGVRTFFSAASRCASADFVAEADQNSKACDRCENLFKHLKSSNYIIKFSSGHLRTKISWCIGNRF